MHERNKEGHLMGHNYTLYVKNKKFCKAENPKSRSIPQTQFTHQKIIVASFYGCFVYAGGSQSFCHIQDSGTIIAPRLKKHLNDQSEGLLVFSVFIQISDPNSGHPRKLKI